MTELQMGLIGLGATAVVGVFAYNKWQEYRHRKLAEKVLDVHHADVLLDEAVRERSVAGPAESDVDLFETAAALPSAEREDPPFDGDPSSTTTASNRCCVSIQNRWRKASSRLQT